MQNEIAKFIAASVHYQLIHIFPHAVYGANEIHLKHTYTVTSRGLLLAWPNPPTLQNSGAIVGELHANYQA